MVTDYTRREAAIKIVSAYLPYCMGHEAKYILGAIIAEMSDNDILPAADVVEVVRCRDCVDCIDGFVCKNGQFRGRTFPNNFCSDGERRGDDGEG